MKEIFWMGLSLWNLMMSFTFLGIGIYLGIKGESIASTLSLILSLCKCFLFAMCVSEYKKTPYTSSGNEVKK